MDPIKKNPLITAAVLGAGAHFLPPGGSWITESARRCKKIG